MKSKKIAEQIGTNGLCILPDFISAKSLERIIEDIAKLQTSGQFRAAQVGRNSTHHPDDRRVRTDSTYWLDRDNSTAIQNLLWRKIDLLGVAINRHLFLGVNDFEGHYSFYPAGGYYERHKDCFQKNSDRVISFVLYLNKEWTKEDGGCLRIFSSRSGHVDIPPIGGTLVCFLSDELPHEVLVTYKPRLSVSGWFKRSPTL